jgi:hypothetical protein
MQFRTSQMAAENDNQKLNALAMDTPGLGETPVCHIYAPQHICTNFQPFWKNSPLEETSFGARERRARSLSRLCVRGYPNPPIDQRGPGSAMPPLGTRNAEDEPAAKPERGRGAEFCNHFFGRVDGSESPSSRSRSLSLAPTNPGGRRDTARGAGAHHPFRSFLDFEDGLFMRGSTCVRLTSDDLLRNPLDVRDLLTRLMGMNRVSWNIYFDPRDARQDDVRYHLKPDDGGLPTKKRWELTEGEGRQAKERAKSHWMCVSFLSVRSLL